MASDSALDNVSASVPSRSETELHFDRQEQRAGSIGGAGVNADVNGSPLPGRQEGVIIDASESGKVEGSGMEYHLHALAEIEEFGAQFKADEIILSPDLRQYFPSEMETILSRLESSASDDPVRQLTSDDLKVPGFGSLFWARNLRNLEKKFGQMPKGWAMEVRLLIMRAAGNCRSLEIIRLYFLDLTFQELKALIDPLKTSLVFRELILHGSSVLDTNEGCTIIFEFLKLNRSLRVLDIQGSDDRPHSIRHYLAIHGHPTVEKISLGRKLKTEEIGMIMQACPNLKEMDYTWSISSEKKAKIYSKALVEHPSFRHVRINGHAGPVSSFLLSSCTGARSVTSLTHLSVEFTSNGERLGRNVLQPMVLANGNLEDIYLDKVFTFSEEWQGMFRSLKHSTVLRRVVLERVLFDEEQGFNLPAWEELVALVKESSSLESLAISRGDAGCQHDLSSLFEAVTSNERGIESLSLQNFQLSSNETETLISMIKENRPLKDLMLWDLHNLSWEDVCNGVRDNSVLTTLGFGMREKINTDPELETLFAALRVNRTLRRITWGRSSYLTERKYALVRYALQEKERQGVVTYAFVSTCTKDKAGVLRSLKENPVLQNLHLSFLSPDETDGEDFDKGTMDELEALVGQSSTLKSLTIHGNGFKHDLRNLFKSMISSKTISSLELAKVDMNAEESETLGNVIQNSSSLQTLILDSIKRAQWDTIFRSLRYNSGLQTLELTSVNTLDGRAFQELLAALHVNSSLETIHLNATNWRDEGKEPIIRKALEQKGRRETYMAAMRTTLGQDEFHVSNTGRLFLCGSPCAGKTQLRMALTQAATGRTHKGRPWSGCFPRGNLLRRTEGIEIQQLNINSLEISIWDLAGQTIFRALQDVLFPKVNLACVFLLVFSPFDRNTNSLKQALSDELYRELLPWLRFIASNSHIASLMPPDVKIVVSHRDKLDHPHSLLWAEDVINNLSLQFAEILSIDKKIFCINSIDLGEDVDDVLNHTVNSFNHLLRNKLFKVPSTCLTLGSALSKLGQYSQSTTNHNLYKSQSTFPSFCLHLGHAIGRKMSKPRATTEPLLSTSQFFDLCQREIVSLKKFNSNDAEGRTLLNAVAEYLHDAGNIIQLVKSDIVVVDPNWFTFSFLGRLIGAGHDFENPLVAVDSYKKKKDGHLSTAAFKDLLRKFSRILSEEGYTGVDEQVLETLMREMNLCFHVPQADGYFAPAIFAEKDLKRSSEGLRKLQQWRGVAPGENIVFVGVRLQCRDGLKTSLTPSFFPRFEVHFRNLLISSRGLRPDQIDCDYNMIYFIFEEYEVYVESDGDAGDHIDIMVRSPTTRTKTIEFIHEKIVPEIENFCTSCCPGVALVVGVLRTECVKKLSLSAHRDENQAILVQDLKQRWKEYILSRDVHRTSWEEEQKHFANYSYLWPSNENASLTESLERAKDLLTDEEYLEVLISAKEEILSMEKQLDGLKSVSDEIDKRIGVTTSETGSSTKQGAQRAATSQPSQRLPRSQKRSLQRQLTDTMTGHDRTHYELQKLRHEVHELNDHVKKVEIIMKDIQRNVKNVQRYQPEILATRVGINSKLDQLIGVTASLARSVVPNRPYFTSANVTWTHRISAAVYIGKPMTLHFMCEERSRNHLVKKQPGYPITVSKENMEFLRFLSVNSIKVLWYLLKAGVHVAAGLGNVIPDLESTGEIAALTETTLGNLLSKELSNVNESSLVESDEKHVDQESWEFLKQLFSNSFRGKCGELFLLYGARYVDAAIESSQVWLCRECAETGKQSNTVVLVDD